MKAAELTGTLLNYWVAKAEGFRVEMRARRGKPYAYIFVDTAKVEACPQMFLPSSDWVEGGEIIEREKLMIQPKLERDGDFYGTWRAVALGFDGRTHSDVDGPSPLIAAMRCYVQSVFGADELPDDPALS